MLDFMYWLRRQLGMPQQIIAPMRGACGVAANSTRCYALACPTHVHINRIGTVGSARKGPLPL